eukprot:1924531-Rhodomonas_salina.3
MPYGSFAVRCPVLTYRMALGDTRCLVLKYRMVGPRNDAEHAVSYKLPCASKRTKSCLTRADTCAPQRASSMEQDVESMKTRKRAEQASNSMKEFLPGTRARI